ncbi:MAG: neutral/alkaline non-lysosomal ceramidase N-terminal domain-containing protein [Armatimonadetes bacterium]|nr:neutral/alkaline non-lysosomal ceramidase N-terminal domain-containing protein [Armatimonadota bacterium]
MRYGLATRDITPDRPVYMAGYAARTELSTGVYLPLEARVLLLDDGEAPFCWVTADLIGFDDELARRAVEVVSREVGAAPERVLLSASHTHCGPIVRLSDEHTHEPGALRGVDSMIVERLGEAAAEAAGALVEGSLSYRIGQCHMGLNRRRQVDGRTVMQPNPEGSTDPEVALLSLTPADPAQPGALLASYACHPTTMGGLLLGPDYPGYLRRGVEAARPDLRVLFANGCAGDIKPGNLDAEGRFAAGPLAAVERCGQEVANAVLAGLEMPGEPLSGPLTIRRERLELPLQPPSERAVYEQAVRGDNAYWRRWGERVLERLDAGEPLPASRPFELAMVTIGDRFCLAALGGEVCHEIGLRLKRELRQRYPLVMVIAYSHNMFGYQAARRQFPEGGYEVAEWWRYHGLPAPYEPDIEDRIVTAAGRLAGLSG